MSDKIEIPADLARRLIEVEHGMTVCSTPWFDRMNALLDAIKAALWQPPVVTVPWIDVKEHPHPTGDEWFLYATDSGFVGAGEARGCVAAITHWCPLPLPPETVAKSPWRSVDDPPEGDPRVWLCGGPVRAVEDFHFSDRGAARTHWALYVPGQPMPPLPEGVKR